MVTIKNYSMPHNCYDCDLHNYHECDLTSESIEEDYCWNGDSREKHCPLREVEAIPKDQYEQRLKADMVAVLTELHLKMEEIGDDLYPTEDWDYGYKSGVEDMIQLLDERIDRLKGESDAQEQKKE